MKITRRVARLFLGGGLLLGLMGMATTAVAQEKPWDENLYNFQAAAGDVVLPMPCGGAMVFRKVVIPSLGPLDDYKVTLGGQDQDMAYSEGTYAAYIAGSFTESDKQRHYLIGKYEVSVLQYQAMRGTCAKPNVPGRLPQVDVSWLDAMSAAEDYTGWLLKNAADKLPHEDKQPGYLRLPTDVEWEFAARGGVAVSPADFQERLFPMSDGLARYAWFQGSTSANGKLQLTGMLKPNPLGIHDVLGNVDEMIFDSFRINKLDRMHGQAGGYSVRGGHYLTAEQSVRTAYRQEQPFFTAAGPRKSKTTGFRLVLVAPVVTSQDRLKKIQGAWSELGSAKTASGQGQGASKLGGEAVGDPVEELGVIIDALDDGNAKKRLTDVRLAMRVSLAQRDEQRDQAAKSSLRLGAFLGRKLRDDSHAVSALRSMHERRKADGNAEDPMLKRYSDKLDQEQAVLEDNLRYYADTVIATSESYSPDVLAHQSEVLSVELEGRGLGGLVAYAQQFISHVMGYKEDKRVARSKWIEDWNAAQ